MRDEFVRTAVSLLSENPDVAVVLAEISVAQFHEQVGDRFADRIINVGIREQLMVGVAAGFAAEGFVPIVHTYAPFLLERAFEQLKLDFSHQGFRGVFVSVGASVDAAAGGRTHQTPEDVAIIASLPDWDVLVPGHRDEVEPLLRWAVTHDGPVYLRLTTEEATTPAPPVRGVAGWKLIRTAQDKDAPTVIAVGPMMPAVLDAVDGIDCTLLYTNRPLEPVAGQLRECATNTVIVVEPYQTGSTLERLVPGLSDRPRRYLSLGFPRQENRRYGTPAEHFTAAGLTPEGIRESILSFVG